MGQLHWFHWCKMWSWSEVVKIIIGTMWMWDKFIFTISNPLLGSHCITPPTPPSEHNLQLSWNQHSPPMHDQTITFNCNAGGPWNRFEHDFNQNSLTLKCLPDNKFETIQWPTCKSGDKIHQDMVLHLKSNPRYYLS